MEEAAAVVTGESSSLLPPAIASLLPSFLSSPSSIGYILSFFTIIVGISLIFFLFQPLLLSSSSNNHLNKKNKNYILFLGSCGSGKTLLINKLAYPQSPNPNPTTIMSSKLSIHKMADLKYFLIDLPGHPKLRFHLYEYLPYLYKIIFLFDSSNTLATLHDSAELLYDLFTSSLLNINSKMLFICNKSDIKGSRPSTRIKLILQDELEKIKNTRNSLEDIDNDAAPTGTNENNMRIPLGRKDKRFTFDSDAPIEIFWMDISVKNDKLQEIVEFIES